MRPRQTATVNERFGPAFNLTLRMLAFALTSQGLRVLLLHGRVPPMGTPIAWRGVAT